MSLNYCVRPVYIVLVAVVQINLISIIIVAGNDDVDCGIYIPKEINWYNTWSIRYVNRSTTLGSIAEIRCERGYILKEGSRYARCGNKGKWLKNDDRLMCAEHRCSGPNEIEYGIIHRVNERLTNQLIFGSAYGVSCDDGYVPDGPPVRTCLDDATWSHGGTLPKCIPLLNWTRQDINSENVQPYDVQPATPLNMYHWVEHLVLLICILFGFVGCIATCKLASFAKRNSITIVAHNDFQHNSDIVNTNQNSHCESQNNDPLLQKESPSSYSNSSSRACEMIQRIVFSITYFCLPIALQTKIMMTSYRDVFSIKTIQRQPRQIHVESKNVTGQLISTLTEFEHDEGQSNRINREVPSECQDVKKYNIEDTENKQNFQKGIKDIPKELVEVKTELVNAEEDTKEKQSPLAKAKDAVNEVQTELANAKKEKKKKDSELAKEKEDVNDVQTELVNAQQKVKEKDSESAKAKNEVNEVQAELVFSKENRKGKDSALTKATDEVNEIKKELMETKDKLKETKDDFFKIKGELIKTKGDLKRCEDTKELEVQLQTLTSKEKLSLKQKESEIHLKYNKETTERIKKQNDRLIARNDILNEKIKQMEKQIYEYNPINKQNAETVEDSITYLRKEIINKRNELDTNAVASALQILDNYLSHYKPMPKLNIPSEQITTCSIAIVDSTTCASLDDKYGSEENSRPRSDGWSGNQRQRNPISDVEQTVEEN